MSIEEYTNFLLTQLKLLGVPQVEIEYREKAFENALMKCTERHVETRYYNLAHEIKCMLFLRQFGNLRISLDSIHDAGCDAILNERYQIEFVCVSPDTKTTESGYDRFGFLNRKDYQPYDYKEVEYFLFERIASVLAEKRDFAERHIKKETISGRLPYLIFLGLGELAPDMLSDDYGMDLLGLLLGKGSPALVISKNDEAFWYYSYRDTISKYNGSTIGSDLFRQHEYSIVSAILFSNACLFDEYTCENTWMFVNPFANNKFEARDFGDLIYWSGNSDDQYVPHRKGVQIV